jgi:hypothetical protein
MHPLSPQDTLHVCPHPECAERLPSLVWACAGHWQALPPQIRQGLWNATRESGTGSLALKAAEQHALDFWAATLPRDHRLAA